MFDKRINYMMYSSFFNMPTEEDDQFVISNKCLELCQPQASHEQKFSFSLNIGSDFSFSQDTSNTAILLFDDQCQPKLRPFTPLVQFVQQL